MTRSGPGPEGRARVGRLELLLVLTLLAAMVGQLAFALVRDGLTYDELVYIACGYKHLVEGDFRLSRNHPPLAKLLIAAPLVPLGLSIPDLRPDDHLWSWSSRFVHEANDANRIIWRARIPNAVLAVALALLVWAWSRTSHGPAAGACALFLTAFHPSLLAHGHLATTDMPGALTVVVASWAFWHWLRRPSRSLALGVGLATGIAVATRFTGWLLLPIFFLAAVWDWSHRRSLPALRQVPVLAAAMLIAVPAVIWASYEGRYAPWFPQAYLRELMNVVSLQKGEHAPTYLLGRWSENGWPQYYLVAFAVKNTPGFLLACLGAAAAAIWRPARGRPVLIHWVVPAVVIFLAASALHFQIGERYVLTVYPFLILLISSAVPRIARTKGGLAAILIAGLLHAAPTIRAAPHGYIPYFNALAGGEAGGHRFFLDSSLDWGQDLPRLASWMNGHGVDKIQLAYFGRDDPGRFHIRHRDLPGGHFGQEGPPQNPFRGVVVISPGILFSPEPADEHYAQLARRPPDDRAGVFFVYRLGEDVPSR